MKQALIKKGKVISENVPGIAINDNEVNIMRGILTSYQKPRLK